DSAVDQMAETLAGGATLAIRWTKTIMNLELRRINSAISDAAFAYETLTSQSQDHQEAVHAFVERRAPAFVGKYPYERDSAILSDAVKPDWPGGLDCLSLQISPDSEGVSFGRQ